MYCINCTMGGDWFLTFHRDHFFGCSFYPLTALILLGGTLIFLALNKRAREKMERKFFI